MSGIQSKFIRNAHNQENRIHNEKKNQSLEANGEIIQIMKLASKDIQSYYNCVPYVQEVNKKIECVK